MWENLEKIKCNRKLIFTKNIENIWIIGIIITLEKRDILDINYEKLKEIIKIKH
jgi:hypothetical protein